ncbi:MAG TPA: fumarate hydratase [Candidatus Cloacimonadota bacterium]|nr:fumarate hydratase [Candidatus Cloacimonadota bacterium]
MSVTRRIDAYDLFMAVKAGLNKIYCQPDPAVISKIAALAKKEKSPLAKDMLTAITVNAEIAAREGIPCCQDTGTVVFFIELGERAVLVDGTIENTIKAVLRLGWYRLNLRRSLVEEPLFERQIIPDTVPPVIHWEINPGNQIKVTMGLKGGGAENMSTLKMMPATSTVEQIKQAVVETVVNAGGKACPPVLVGVGIGGNYESCALMAKRALFEELGRAHPDPRYATLEKEILAEINRQGRGVMGMGEGPSALAVHIKTAPCHIASLPLAVNLDCHAHRHYSFTL